MLVKTAERLAFPVELSLFQTIYLRATSYCGVTKWKSSSPRSQDVETPRSGYLDDRRETMDSGDRILLRLGCH